MHNIKHNYQMQILYTTRNNQVKQELENKRSKLLQLTNLLANLALLFSTISLGNRKFKKKIIDGLLRRQCSQS